MRLRRIIGVTAAMACAPTLAVAAPIETTLRVEGADATIIPTTQVTVDDAAGATVTVRDTADADSIAVPANSATAQVSAAAHRFGLPYEFQVFNFGVPSSFVTRIGQDAMPASFSPSWRLTVNGKRSDVGQDAVLLKAGDSVVWAFTSNFEARELDLAVSGDRFAQGSPFTATVTSVDTDPHSTAAPAPAAGAIVTYGGQRATADGQGRVTFRAVGVGVQPIVATRADEVRSPAHAVCSYTDDPTVCALPPAAPAAAPNVATPTASAPTATAPVPTGLADTVAPGSEITSLVSGRRYTRIVAIRGRTGADRSDIARVDVAVARRVGTRCRYMGPRGVFGPIRACRGPRFVPARSSGNRWIRPFRAPLAPGKYLVLSRATDGAGNRETTTMNTINTSSFTIIRRTVARRVAR